MPHLRPLLLVLLVVLTGCLTIEERYTFKKDGSGTMTYVVDMSEMGEMMDGLSKVTKEAGGSDEPVMELDEEAEALKVLPGISKVKVSKGKEWVRSVTFRFKDIAALNAALNVLMPDSTGQQHTFFSWEGNTLVRRNNRFASELGESMGNVGKGDEDAAEGEDALDMGMLLGSMKYKYSFKFANAITSTTSEEGVEQERKGTKEVFWNTDWSVIAKNDKALDLRIDLDR